MYLVYLAAGRGSRLPKQYRKQPKCLTKIKDKTIFERNTKFFNKFKKKIIITGYKRNKLSNLIRITNFKEIFNKNYNNTNMVHSLMLSTKYIKKNYEITICYGDILFENRIFNTLKKNRGNIMLINSKWLKYWKKRMNIKKVKKDAEDLIIHKKKLISIGNKIKDKLPRYQYMGIFKVSKRTLQNMNLFYKKIKSPKIDMTNFLNLCIKKNILSMKTAIYSSMWHEIDHHNDIKLAEKELN